MIVAVFLFSSNRAGNKYNKIIKKLRTVEQSVIFFVIFFFFNGEIITYLEAKYSRNSFITEPRKH